MELRVASFLPGPGVARPDAPNVPRMGGLVLRNRVVATLKPYEFSRYACSGQTGAFSRGGNVIPGGGNLFASSSQEMDTWLPLLSP